MEYANFSRRLSSVNGIAAFAIATCITGCNFGADNQHDYLATHASDLQTQGYVMLDSGSLSGTFGDRPFSLDTATFPGWQDQGNGSAVIFSDSGSIYFQPLDGTTVAVTWRDVQSVVSFRDGFSWLSSASPAAKPQDFGAVELGLGVAVVGAVDCGAIIAPGTCLFHGGVNWDSFAVYDIYNLHGGGFCPFTCNDGYNPRTAEGWGSGSSGWDGQSSSSYCGDSSCNGSEDCSSCPQDCGSCQSSCTPNNYTSCSNGNVYWFDSCGNKGSLSQSCNGCGCSGNSCDSCGPSCTPNSYTSCSNGNVYWFDSCGNKGSLSQSCNGCGCSGNSCSPCVNPQVSVNPNSATHAQTCLTQNLWGFTPFGTATCHPKNQWGDTTFPLGLDGNGAHNNTYCPSASAGLGQYEFWCVDNTTGLSSNHVFFTIL